MMDFTRHMVDMSLIVFDYGWYPTKLDIVDFVAMYDIHDRSHDTDTQHTKHHNCGEFGHYLPSLAILSSSDITP